MAVSNFRTGTAAWAAGNLAAVTPTLPSSVVTGTLLILYIFERTASQFLDTTALASAGWTQKAVVSSSQRRSYVYTKTAGAAEGNPTASLTGGAATDVIGAIVITADNLAPEADPFAGAPVTNTNGTSDLTIEFGAYTPDENDAAVLILAGIGADQTAQTQLTNFTNFFLSASGALPGTGVRASMLGQHWIQTTATAVSAGAITCTGTASQSSSVIFALRNRPTPTIPAGYQGIQITDITPPVGAVSLLDGLAFTAEVGDWLIVEEQAEEAVTSIMSDITVDGDGTFLIDTISDARQEFNYYGWDLSTETFDDEATVYVNNVAPVQTGAVPTQVLEVNEAMVAVDVTDYWLDEEGDTCTHAVQSGTLPTGTSIAANGMWTGTPTVDQETGSAVIRVTDVAGDFEDLEVDWSVQDTVVVPNVVGMLYDAAVIDIEAAGLTVGDVLLQESSEPEDTVLSQDPIDGTVVLATTEVALVLATPVVDDIIDRHRRLKARGAYRPMNYPRMRRPK